MTDTMRPIFFLLFLISMYIDHVVSSIGDPTAKIRFTKVQVSNVANPYAATWQGEIVDSGDRITFKIPLKADLPAGIRLKGVTKFQGIKVADVDIPICDAFKDEVFVRTILDAGTPKDKFPTSCPIKASEEYVIEKYKFPSQKIPPGIPNGNVIADVQVYEPGKKPFITIHVEANISHQIPGSGR